MLERSGARLVEVGTTNRTRATDYERAIGPDTALLLRVHQSNFRVVGFTELPAVEELADLARRHGLPLVDDLGSGVLVELPEEPSARQSLEAGADLVCFSGDKLLGGPQAGIVVGRAELVERLRRHPAPAGAARRQAHAGGARRDAWPLSGAQARVAGGAGAADAGRAARGGSRAGRAAGGPG